MIALCLSTLYSADITVEIKNISSKKGKIRIALFDNPKEFKKKRGAVARAILPIKSNRLHYTFTKIPKGNYAIALFHDENSNQKLDYNFFGIPTEGYAFSNNPKVFGEPSFEDAQFELKKSTKMTLRVKY